MRKTISPAEVDGIISRIANRKSAKKNEYIVEADGKRVCAIISAEEIEDFEKFKISESKRVKAKSDFFKWVRKVQKKASKYSEKEKSRIVDEAVRWARGQKINASR